MMIRLLSAGAAMGVVHALTPRFREALDAEIDATFGAVGAMKALLDAGSPCDAIVLTQSMIDALATERRVLADTIAPLGRVQTAIAVRDGDVLPDVSDARRLRSALEAAGALYFPDPERATAGIHFISVLRTLGIDTAVRDKLRPFANGATAMRTLAEQGRYGDIGCTQMTEIVYTSGVTPVAALPDGLGLATTYTAAVTRAAEDVDGARRFVALLTGDETRELRARGGFEQPKS